MDDSLPINPLIDVFDLTSRCYYYICQKVMFLKALIIGKRRFGSKTVLLSYCMSCINRMAAFAL